MSVIVAKRNESRLEAIFLAEKIHHMLIEIMQKSFGIKDVDQFVRVEYAHGKIEKEDFGRYQYIMINSKKEIDRTALLLTNNLRAANSIYPTSPHELEQRRDYLNNGIINCNQIMKQLQHVADIFNVNLNIYKDAAAAIENEIHLIKKWRQRDNRFKTNFQDNI